MFEYDVWKSDTRLPIECAVNVLLLHEGVRDVVQLDATYYAGDTRDAMEEFVAAVTADGRVASRRDAARNAVLYMRSNAELVEDADERTTAFAKVLDADFYVTPRDLGSGVWDGAVRASIDVVCEGRAGPLLVQMAPRDAVAEHVGALYARFLTLTNALHALDPTLHTTLTLYTKPGAWRDGPEYCARTLDVLP